MLQPSNSSAVFAAPTPLENPFRTIDELLKSHASEPRDISVVGYPAFGVADFEEHTAKDLDKFADAAVARFVKLGIKPAVSTHLRVPFVER